MKLVKSFDTGLTADCVEVWDAETVAVGTYQLTDGQRHGRLYRMDGELGVREALDLSAGILDMKYGEDGRLAMALSDGSVWLDGSRSMISEEGRILLSLDWGGPGLALSDDQGRVHLWDAQAETVTQSWTAHSLEAWHCSFNSHLPSLLYTAGDDGSWAEWDVRTAGPLPTHRSSSRHHQAGVCSVQAKGDKIFTGSYDRNLMQWDRRNLKCPVSTLSFGSGVWRLRWRHDFLLVAAMHDGFHLVDVHSMNRLAHYPTASLAYGCAWLADRTVLGCTFYDHTLHLLSL